MAVITITPSAVLASSNAQVARGIAGETLVQGKAICIDPDDSNRLKLYLSADGDTLPFAGITLNSASTGQVIRYVTSDPSLTIGATVDVGKTIYAGNSAGLLYDDIDDISAGSITPISSVVTETTVNLNPILPSGFI